MKYWVGYLTAAIFAGFTWVLMQLGEKYSMLVDMVYPYVTRSVQTFLTAWTAPAPFLVWQVAVVLFVVLVLASLVLVLVLKGNVVQWLGWVLAVVRLVIFLNTGVYGLNYYAGDLADDLRLDVMDYTLNELEKATEYYRDQADRLAVQMPRDPQGGAVYPDFETLSQQTGSGYRKLVLENSFSVFGGDYTPVKKLGWADMYSSMGITGFTCFLTGEAAVNPQIPGVSQPFTMAHEMAHRLCIAKEDDANFAAFLACSANESMEYQYSAYFMAYRYCYNALFRIDAVAAGRINAGCSPELKWDLQNYSQFFEEKRDENATQIADTVNDTYLKASGEEEGIQSYGAVCDLLVSWYMNECVEEEELPEYQFDPYDETQVDLSGIVNAKDSYTAETEPAA